jgi:hypothetical protein
MKYFGYGHARSQADANGEPHQLASGVPRLPRAWPGSPRMLRTHGQQHCRSVPEHGETVSVGGRAVTDAAIAPGDSRRADRLRGEIRGAVLFDRADRGRYATDASIYQVQPIGVIVPEEVGDVAAALSIAREEGVPVLPRGGGTSKCGQTVNRALVIDCS